MCSVLTTVFFVGDASLGRRDFCFFVAWRQLYETYIFFVTDGAAK
jgi:hypothetical protein